MEKFDLKLLFSVETVFIYLFNSCNILKQVNIRRRKRRYTGNQPTRSTQQEQDRAFEISEVISEPVENVYFPTSDNTANTVGAECNN